MCAPKPLHRTMTSKALTRYFRALLLAMLLASQLQAILAQTPTATTINVAADPTSADLRTLFDQWGLAQGLQKDRPTCSAFTVLGAIEFAVAKRQGHTPRLSVEFINWAANKTCGDKADGGFFSDLWKGFSAYGVSTAADLLYQTRFDPSIEPPPEAFADAKTRLNLGLRLNWIKEWNVNTGLTDAQLRAIKRTLDQRWPVCAGLRWPKSERWIDSVLQMCPPDAVRDGHSVLLVGYREDPAQPGGGVLLFRNSANAGRDGMMPYTYAQAYMNDAAWIDFESRQTLERKSSSDPTLLTFNPLTSLWNPPVGRNRRISSNEQPRWNDANLDMNILPPGKSIEMPVLEGPGVITHIWMTSHAGRVNELNALTLRIYWDGRPQPGVEVPLGEFFGVGQGKPAAIESVPVQVSPTGALTCYWKMPFAKSARIVVSNDNPDRTTGLYWQIDWTELPEVPKGTPYFHARYHQSYPAAAGDYLIADLEGSGFYVGTMLSITLGQNGWWGEGDDFFYIDGELVPSLQGTGAEDYFNDAWGFRPRTGNWFGQPRWQGDRAGDSGASYRWHVLDPVNFSNSLKVTIEHKGNHEEDTEGFYVERPDFINSVAFWYQVGEPKPGKSIPSYPDRAVPWQNHHLVRAFNKLLFSNNIKPEVQFAGMFGARPVVVWSNTEPGAALTVSFPVSDDGEYAIRLTVISGPDYGQFDIELDGKTVVARADFRSVDYDELDLALGTHHLQGGEHSISLRSLATEGNLARPLAVEMVRLLRLPNAANRAVKTHHEAHFVRLGIGRAVYAYRLANGVLPESLDTLVRAGLMPARYLADENNRPLRSRREGNHLIVESVGPDPWTHRWQGLDARR